MFLSEKGTEELEEEKPPEPQGPPEPEPGSEDWEYVDQPIDVVRFYKAEQTRMRVE